MKSKLRVAVPRPLRTLLTYLPNTETVAVGCRVSVPLGHTSSMGVVMGYDNGSGAAKAYALKTIRQVLDKEALLDQHLIDLLQWAAAYYHYPIGEVVFAALPKLLREGKALPDPTVWQAVEHPDAAKLLKYAKRQQAMYDWLNNQAQASPTETLREQFGSGWSNYLHSLQKKGLVEAIQPTSRLNTTIKNPSTKQTANTILQLTAQQTNCLQQCQTWMKTEKPRPILLQGITGSGKTEIYLRLMTEVLAQGRQVLVLVPEIGLTPQLLQRFQHYFPQQTLVSLHSKLSDTERWQAWLKARNQQADIIIGTRSVVFTPCPALGLIVVDEEHDQSFKQQDTFRYHGRDLAIKRAQLLNIPILLGSATPALETLHNVQTGRYHSTHLDQRPGLSRTPSLHVQDIRGQDLQSGLSPQTLLAIRCTLERDEQVMLFINRRGFAPLLLCPSCGWQGQCEHCSSSMTFHARQGKLICHHCAYQRAVYTECPQCHNPKLTTQGQGTERIELTLKHYFPDTPLVRIDRDSTSRKGALQQHLATIAQHKRLLIIGTQMLAKGHDFPNLTLVIILDVDQSLLSPEYHALERFGQLMTQVAGRAGRSHKAGQVILQTTQPQHPVLLTLLQQGYPAFAKQLLKERQRWQFPPYGYQALIRADAPEMDMALEILLQIKDVLTACNAVQLMGPTPAPLEKRAGRYRAQLLVQSTQRNLRHQCLSALIRQEKSLRTKKNVRWSIDIDPVELS